MEWTFDTKGPIEADLVVPHGQVAIEEGSGEQVVVVLEPLGESSPRVDEVIAGSQVKFARGKLHVRVGRRRGRRVAVDCKVVLPERSSVSANTGSADVRCTAPLRGFRGSTASGQMSVVEVDADASVRSASGDFRGEAVGGALLVKAASSDVTVERVGGDVVVALASGGVSIGDAAASVTARTASGNVRVGRAHAGKVRVETATGDITVGVAAGVGAHLDVTSGTGVTSCTLPVEETAATEAALDILCRTATGDVRIEGAPA